ncbi:hypothetical protein [Pseudomonas helleri]|uniref:Uncharacterized protein n=1 Tax=Pseudomonas helleri TaxID=1608996 RepID=A0A7X1Y4X0_9PSED|nr:hypothetical protein [Pseudomonas helleri]MQT94925.1 hypothetical protein [Pseudomonas helleri]MQU30301.1 hypothetical protein [Pseudomonas helleri]
MTQLQAKKNFRRVAAEENLSTWSAAVFGYGEKVNIFLPRYVHQNTRLGTIQALSTQIRDVASQLVAQVHAEYEDDDDVFEPVDDKGDDIRARVEALREDKLGVRVLENIQDEQQALEPGLLRAVAAVLERHKNDPTFDAFDMARSLMSELNPTMAMARRALNEWEGRR